MITRLLTYFLPFILCLSQHPYISPKHSFTISINHPQLYSQTYLIEISQQDFLVQWASIVAHYDSLTPQTIIQASFNAVSKAHSTQIAATLGNCRFAGASAQWCKIGQESPPFNWQQNLLKVQLQCLAPCQGEFFVGITQTNWDGQSKPKFFGGPLTTTAPLFTRKTEALVKIIGWMLFTYLVIMGAIKLATNLADRLDKKPVRAYYETKEE